MCEVLFREIKRLDRVKLHIVETTIYIAILIGVYLFIGVCCSAQGPSVPPSGNVFQFPDFSVGPQESRILIGILAQLGGEKEVLDRLIDLVCTLPKKYNASRRIVFLPVVNMFDLKHTDTGSGHLKNSFCTLK